MKYELRSIPSKLLEGYVADDFTDRFSYGTDIDIYKKDDSYLLELEMPGFDKKDIQVEFKGDILSIKAEHTEDVEEDAKNYFYQSRSFKNVHRQIRFADVDEVSVEAEYENGVLKIVLPTKVEEELTNKIDVK